MAVAVEFWCAVRAASSTWSSILTRAGCLSWVSFVSSFITHLLALHHP